MCLALLSLPLAAGALLGRASSHLSTVVVSAACLGTLVVAALLAVLGTSVIVPPLGADLLVVLVAGVVSGRVLGATAPGDAP
jgi:hypothetical protein